MKPTLAELRALARRDPRLARAWRALAPFPGFPQRGHPRQRSHYAALTSAIVVEPDLFGHLHGELVPECSREQSHQAEQPGLHERPDARPRRLSATVAVRLRRRASAARARRPEALSA